MLSITGALGWKQGYDVLEAMGDVTDADTEAAYELGGTIAALLAEPAAQDPVVRCARPRVLDRPVERLVGDRLPARLRAGPVRAAGEVEDLGEGRATWRSASRWTGSPTPA